MNEWRVGTDGTGSSIWDYKLEEKMKRKNKENEIGKPVPPVPSGQKKAMESEGIIAKSPRNSTQEARWQLYRRLVEQDGIKCQEAAKLCGFAPDYGYQINQKLKARGQTVATIPEKLYRKADRRAAMILDAKPWGSMKEVRDSAVTSVISEIWRRKYPTKCEPIPENISFTKVDLSLVRVPPLEPASVDPTPCIPHKNFGQDEEPA